MGSDFNVKMLWETGLVTYEPLHWLAKDIPVKLAQYAIEHNLLDTSGWKRFKRYARQQRQMERLIKQAKLRSFSLRPKYKYGFEVPRDYDHVLQLDQQNGNMKWFDANVEEHKMLQEYDVFIDKGVYQNAKVTKRFVSTQSLMLSTMVDTELELLPTVT